VAVETEAEESLTITIPEIGRCLHDWEWADADEWDRDLANAELIVTAVNERDALLAEVGRLREALKSMKQAAEFSLSTPGLIRGRDQLKNAVEAAAVSLALH